MVFDISYRLTHFDLEQDVPICIIFNKIGFFDKNVRKGFTFLDVCDIIYFTSLYKHLNFI